MRNVLNRDSSAREASDPQRLDNAGQRVLRAARGPANRPHFRPHISATPRDETDSEQHVLLKTIDMRNETDIRKPMASSF
jgi:hypothetical protein